MLLSNPGKIHLRLNGLEAQVNGRWTPVPLVYLLAGQGRLLDLKGVQALRYTSGGATSDVALKYPPFPMWSMPDCRSAPSDVPPFARALRTPGRQPWYPRRRSAWTGPHPRPEVVAAPLPVEVRVDKQVVGVLIIKQVGPQILVRADDLPGSGLALPLTCAAGQHLSLPSELNPQLDTTTLMLRLCRNALQVQASERTSRPPTRSRPQARC